MTAKPFPVAGRLIGPGTPPYIIAELSGNHNGDIARAFAIMEAAAKAGVDAVKLQTYTPDTMTIDSGQTDFIISGGPWDGYTLYDLYREAHTPWDWHPRLFAKARELGLTVFSTPFDSTSVDFLESMNVPAYKIASFELVDLALIEQVAATGKPLIMSTGMASHSDVADAVATARGAGCCDLALLYCVSGYPTPVSEANILAMPELARLFQSAVIGFSDHTLGTAASVAAVALGAAIIEKHVTLRRSDGGPDAAFSLEPNELSELVCDCRTGWEALGQAGLKRKSSEEGNRMFRRSLYAVANIAPGEELTRINVRAIRPGFGLPPKDLGELLGRRAKSFIERGTAMAWDLVD